MNEPFQLRFLRLQADLRSRLHNAQDSRKVLVYGLRVIRELFEVPQGAVATLKPGSSTAQMSYSIPKSAPWDLELLTRYIRGERPKIPKDTLMAPVRRHARHWSVVALRAHDATFEPSQREALFSLTRTLTAIVREVDDRRARKVRRKIEREIANRQEPKDLIYDLLHGLRSLTRYDHSAALLIAKQGDGNLELVAEQIAWTKARSQRIGSRFQLDESIRRPLEDGRVRLYELESNGWSLRRGTEPKSLPTALQTGVPAEAPPERSILCAPISTPHGAFALLRISAWRHGILGDWEASLVEEFLPLLSLAVQFSVRTESLQEKVLQSERKHALANLTRGITHDVNNAVGAMLPLVQQMLQDARDGSLETATLSEDLASIEASLQTCRRIFGGMLAIARGSTQTLGHGNLRRAIDGALSVLGDSLKRRAIEVSLELPRALPTIRGSQGDLTQLFLNLFANARDAMPDGGNLKIGAETGDGCVEVSVEDSGTGIPEPVLARISEPFFTTKAEGNGLGLAICRSILWDIGGLMEIDSEAGRGTLITVELPVLRKDAGEVVE